MEQRKLGSQGLNVSALGLGCMGMSFAYGMADEAESEATLRRAVELGITLFDTAEIYGPYKNEELIGRVLQGQRERIILATKFGFSLKGTERVGLNSRPENVKAVADASLKRLRTDRIDLYYQHRVDPAVPIEETVGAMAELVKAGKVRYLGLSEAAPDTIRRAHKVHPISTLQSEYSLWFRDPEKEILPTCRALGIGFVPYSPLGRGFLTGTVDPTKIEKSDFRRSVPRFQGENAQKNRRLVEKVIELARKKKATPAQLSLAWLLHQGEDIVPIPGTKRIRYLEENAAAVALKLSPEELAAIEAAVPADAVAGARYPEPGMSMIDRS
jgi:aryl-alcohol dehydrogenase-like predicted oxidoreductase